MHRQEAFEAVVAALKATSEVPSDIELTDSTDLIDSGLLDSLDVMMFLFNLEQGVGTSLDSIDEDHTDFTIGAFVTAVEAATAG